MQKEQLRQHIISYILLSLFFIVSTAPLKASNIGKSQNKQKQDILSDPKFSPYMATHLNPGCPENSVCNKLAGKKMAKWTGLLEKTGNIQTLNKHRKKNGIPLSLWSLNHDFKDRPIILWDSTCPLHNKKNNVFKEIILFKKNKLNIKDKNIFFEDLFLLRGKNKISKYLIPRNEKPLYLDGKSLIILKEEQGRYFGIKIDDKNNFRLVKTIIPKSLPVRIECPKILQTEFSNKKLDKTFYIGNECKRIWNKKTNTFATIMYGITCF